MSAMSYLEYVSDLMANGQFKNEQAIYKSEANQVACNLRAEYSSNIKKYVCKIL